MTVLTDGILLYHGSFTEVSSISLEKCKHGKDFGCGFYVTSSYEQAQNFVPLSITKQINQGLLPASCSTGYISVFQLHLTPDISIHSFNEANKEWLYFVASNRRKNLFPAIRTTYDRFDIIGGKIANDRTARTLQLYISGGYGEPGSKEADDIAITTLLPNRLEDQFCFRSIKAIQTLEFIRSDSYDINH